MLFFNFIVLYSTNFWFTLLNLLSVLLGLSHVGPNSTLWSWHFYCPCFTDNEAKSQGDNETGWGNLAQGYRRPYIKDGARMWIPRRRLPHRSTLPLSDRLPLFSNDMESSLTLDRDMRLGREFQNTTVWMRQRDGLCEGMPYIQRHRILTSEKAAFS